MEGGRLTADLEDVFPDFEVAFEGNEDGSTFYRSARTRALNEEYGDMLHKILDLEACAPALPCCTPRMCRSRCGCCKQMQHAGCMMRPWTAAFKRLGMHTCVFCTTARHVPLNTRGHARMAPPKI